MADDVGQDAPQDGARAHAEAMRAANALLAQCSSDTYIAFNGGLPAHGFGAGVAHAWLAGGLDPPSATGGLSLGSVSAAALSITADATIEEGDRVRWLREYVKVAANGKTFARQEVFFDPTALSDLSPRGVDRAIVDAPKILPAKATGPLLDAPAAPTSNAPPLDEALTAAEAHRLNWMRLIDFIWRLPVPFRLAGGVAQFWSHHKRKDTDWSPLWPHLLSLMGVGTVLLLRGLGLRFVEPPRADGASSPTPPLSMPVKLSAGLALLAVLVGLILTDAVAVFIALPFVAFSARALHHPEPKRSPLLGTPADAYAVRRPLQPLVMKTMQVFHGVAALLFVGLLAWRPFDGLTRLLGAWAGVFEGLVGLMLGLALTFAIVTLWLKREEFASVKALGAEFAALGGIGHPAFFRGALAPLFDGKQGKSPVVVALSAWLTEVNGRRPLVSNVPVELARTTPSDLLAAAMAVPFFKLIEPARDRVWHADAKPGDYFDAGYVRANPLPALFGWFETDDARRATPHGGTLYVVYGDPPVAPRGAQRWNIVDAAHLSIRLALKEDLDLEARQTWFATVMIGLRKALHGDRTGHYHNEFVVRWLLPDGAPPVGVRSADAFYHRAAAGCRRTLEARFANELAPCVETPCHPFLDRKFPSAGKRRLSQICARCPRTLRAQPAERPGPQPIKLTADVVATLERRPTQVSGQTAPRVVLVANGGVFRGAYQIGVVAGFTLLGIKPDLIIGGSVGNIMGALFARMTQDAPKRHDPAHPPKRPIALSPTARRAFEAAAGLFLDVEDEVAMTRPLRRLLRQVLTRVEGLRLRLNQTHPAHASGDTTQGAELVVALSHLLRVPKRQAEAIVADLVEGHEGRAWQLLLQSIKTETVRHFGVEDAAMGASLLEQRVRTVLGSAGAPAFMTAQPFIDPSAHREGTAFFSTATRLDNGTAVILGDARLCPDGEPYDFVKALMACTAFPGVFAPVPETDFLPLSGRPEHVYNDGGIFDNLPIMPAIEILAMAQYGARETGDTDAELGDLSARLERPDLFLVAALDPDPSKHTTHSKQASRRAERAAYKINEGRKIVGRGALLADDLVAPNPTRKALDPGQRKLVQGIVSAAIHAVYPTSAKTLNGTFAFAPEFGFDAEKALGTMVDGCYTALASFATRSAPPREGDRRSKTLERADVLLHNAYAGLADRFLEPKKTVPAAKVDRVRRPDRLFEQREVRCPFFTVAGEPIECPFADLRPSRPGVAICRKAHAEVHSKA